MGKFESVLKIHGLLKEAEFVKGNERSELPDNTDDLDVGDDEEAPESPEGSQDQPPEENEEPSDVYSNREKNILEVALKLHLSNSSVDLETRNELDNLFKNEDWESLHRRLISIVDGLDITA